MERGGSGGANAIAATSGSGGGGTTGATTPARMYGLHPRKGTIAVGADADLALPPLPRPVRAVGVNVAGESARVRVEAQLARWRVAPEWLVATDSARGVTVLFGGY